MYAYIYTHHVRISMHFEVFKDNCMPLRLEQISYVCQQNRMAKAALMVTQSVMTPKYSGQGLSHCIFYY